MQKDLKTQTDDDFEKLLDDFINGKYDGALETELPFPNCPFRKRWTIEWLRSSSTTTMKSTNAWMTSLPLI